MNRFPRIVTTVALASAAIAGTAEASGLKGSPASMRNQHAIALSEDYTFLRTPSQVRHFASEGRLDTVPGNADYRVNKVSFPYARPEVVSFIERLAREYHQQTGELLVVTSLTRPTANQPGNAHRLSVHPAGMAVDLRVPFKPSQREWIEARLLDFEEAGVLDVTKERNPPHYHVAVFPGEFREWAEANPMPLSGSAAATFVARLSELQQPLAALAPLGQVDAADVGGGSFSGWAFTALAGLVLAGGAAARRLERVASLKK
jgi:hypothetical protein